MKKYLALILAAAMLISFAACKRDKEPEANASQTSSETVTEQPTEAPTPEPAEEPTPEPTQRPEITEMPDAVSVDELTPVVTIPLVFDTEYDPDRDFACIEKLNVYGDGDAPIHTYGPAAYTVDEDRLIVLDAIGGLIRIYDIDTGEWIKNVDASAAKIDPLSNEGSIAFRDGLYWIYSVEERIIVALDDEGTAVKTVPAPKAGNMAEYEDQDAYIRAWASIVTAELLVTDGELIFKTHGCISYDMPDYKLLDDAFISCEPSVKYNITDYPDWAYIITKDERTWRIPTDEELSFTCRVQEIDEEGDLYLTCNLISYDEIGRALVDSSLRIYDKDSRLVGIFRYTMREPIAYGTHIVRKDMTGVWIMSCTEDEVRIFKLPFSVNE